MESKVDERKCLYHCGHDPAHFENGVCWKRVGTGHCRHRCTFAPRESEVHRESIMPLKPKPGENVCWRIGTEDSMPWRGWSLNTGQVSWSRVCGSEEDALRATKELLQIKMNQLTKLTGQIDRRLVRIAGDVINGK